MEVHKRLIRSASRAMIDCNRLPRGKISKLTWKTERLYSPHR